MAIFLMIHGAWHDGSTFEPLRAGLEAQGHRLIAPDLPGMGADRTPYADVTLDRWAGFVADIARAQPEPVILCGHSRGGVVISQAAESAPEAIAKLVYITAFLIPDGTSLNDHVSDVPRVPAFEEGIAPIEGGLALSLTPEGATAAFYHRVAPEKLPAALSHICPEPTVVLGTPLAITDARFGAIERHYIECTDDQAIPIAQQRSFRAKLPVASVSSLDSDHSPFLTCPDQLVDALDRIARGG